MSRATQKRKLLNPQKSQLLFVEQPRNGSRHEYGPQLRSAINPRSFVSEQLRQGVPDRSWVAPQFTTLEDTAVRYGGQRRKKKNQLPTSTLNRTSLSTQVRKPTVCKYPALLFDTSNSVPLRCRRGLGRKSAVSHDGDSSKIQPPQSHRDRTVSSVSLDDMPRQTSLNTRRYKASTSGVKLTPKNNGSAIGKLTTLSSVTPCTSTADTSRVLTPPHIQTPEIPRCERFLLNLLFSSNEPRTPPRTENLLVRDTPESDYGLKVTWRRRKKLRRLLTERGQLLDTEAMISNRYPETV